MLRHLHLGAHSPAPVKKSMAGMGYVFIEAGGRRWVSPPSRDA